MKARTQGHRSAVLSGSVEVYPRSEGGDRAGESARLCKTEIDKSKNQQHSETKGKVTFNTLHFSFVVRSKSSLPPRITSCPSAASPWPVRASGSNGPTLCQSHRPIDRHGPKCPHTHKHMHARTSLILDAMYVEPPVSGWFSMRIRRCASLIRCAVALSLLCMCAIEGCGGATG